MHKKVLIPALVLSLGYAPAFALQLTINCPASVKVGTPLNVGVNGFNDSFTSLTLSRYMSLVAVNSDNTLGNVGVFGPFARAVPAKLIPPFSNIPPFTVTVTNVTPAPTGKMATTVVSFIDGAGHTLGTASCLVSIVP